MRTHPFGNEELHAFGDAVRVLGQVLGADPRLVSVSLQIRLRELEEADSAAPLFPKMSQQFSVHDVLHDQQVGLCKSGTFKRSTLGHIVWKNLLC
jgi:hypothetical protein